MEKRELEVMLNYYRGTSKLPLIWDNDVMELHQKKLIRKIYEVIDKEFDETWYLIRDTKEHSYIVKPKFGNTLSKDMMKKYRKKYDFNRIDTEILKKFENGFFPIVFKVSKIDFRKFYNKLDNKNNAFFNNYYCCWNVKYRAVRIYNNKVEYKTFEDEDDAIYWCSQYKKTKDDILKNKIRPTNLIDYVYEL